MSGDMGHDRMPELILGNKNTGSKFHIIGGAPACVQQHCAAHQWRLDQWCVIHSGLQSVDHGCNDGTHVDALHWPARKAQDSMCSQGIVAAA
jgi:hypothetical protein